jgi:type II secretory pathway predicted ATPase ExeA
MYRKHFGIAQSPFNITPNPAFFYRGNTRGEMLNALLYAVTHGEGIIRVTGEVGSGKTMLCRMLESKLPANVVVLYLVNPSLGPDEVLYAIATELSLNIADKRIDEVLRLLHTDLITRHAAGQRVVLLVEEAQAMPLATLEAIRLLTNLETANDKLLQIVLFGQPELNDNLRQPSMRQLSERITHSLTVPPMANELVGDFLAFRLHAAGYAGPPLFDEGAVALIAQTSAGIVRRINILADKALLAAFADDAFFVRIKHVQQALQDSGFGAPPPPLTLPRRQLWWGAAVSLLALLMVWQLLELTGVLPAAGAGVTRLVQQAQPLPFSAAALPPATAPAAPSPPPQPVVQPATTVATAPVTASTTAAPAVAPEAAVATTPAPANVLDQALGRTALWLASEPPQHLTLRIALLPSDNRPRIEDYLRTTQASIGLDQVHVYALTVNGEPRIAVTYGRFFTRREAAQVQSTLAERAAFRPQIVTVSTMRNEVREAGETP